VILKLTLSPATAVAGEAETIAGQRMGVDEGIGVKVGVGAGGSVGSGGGSPALQQPVTLWSGTLTQLLLHV